MIFYIATDPEGFRQLRTRQDEAKAIDKGFVKIDIPTDSAGLRAAIQELLTEADTARNQLEESLSSGESEALDSRPELSPSPPPKPSYTDISVAIDEAWDKLSLAHQLHFASLAMERARTSLKE